MKRLISKAMILMYSIFLVGCAAIYKPINPPSLNYISHDLQDGIGFSYKYDVLLEKGNRKYANKEYKKGMKLVAVKMTNNTDSILNVGRDLVFYAGQKELNLLEPIAIKNSIKQIVPGYLTYLLLSFTYINVSSGNTSKTYPIGLVLGPVVTFGNVAVAASANNKMFNELQEYNVLSRDIQKGETIYGIIGIRNIGSLHLTIKFRN